MLRRTRLSQQYVRGSSTKNLTSVRLEFVLTSELLGNQSDHIIGEYMPLI